MANEFNKDGVILLAIEVVKAAAKDYKKAYKAYIKNPNNEDKKRECKRLERWFKSDDFQLYCSFDGDEMIERLRQDVISNKNV